MKQNAEKIIRIIDAFPHQPDWSQQIRNCRVDKAKLKKYLQTRYSARIANKMVALFDFNMPLLDYRTFYKQLIETVID